MNPVTESLLGIKAFNDQFIAQDMLQDNRLRMTLLAECIEAAADDALMEELLAHLMHSIYLEERLLKLCLDQDWLTADASEQWERDIKWASKVRKMMPRRR
ncbi:hypothetical protein CM49_00699 [Paenibacillus sp. P1XP2]|nr:hypothetical protein CM49_00699 [Paenibacillus sp. P1XP2]